MRNINESVLKVYYWTDIAKKYIDRFWLVEIVILYISMVVILDGARDLVEVGCPPELVVLVKVGG